MVEFGLAKTYGTAEEFRKSSVKLFGSMLNCTNINKKGFQ
jgi:hypothetical protein